MCDFCKVSGVVAAGYKLGPTEKHDFPLFKESHFNWAEPKAPNLPFQPVGWELVKKNWLDWVNAKLDPTSRYHGDPYMSFSTSEEMEMLRRWANSIPSPVESQRRDGYHAIDFINPSSYAVYVSRDLIRADSGVHDRIFNRTRYFDACREDAVGVGWSRNASSYNPIIAAQTTMSAWELLKVHAWGLNMFLAATWNLAVPDDQKVCLQCVGEWKEGAETVGSKVNCGHIHWNPRYASIRHQAGEHTCLTCNTANVNTVSCSACNDPAERARIGGMYANGLLGPNSACTNCCPHRSCDRCGTSFISSVRLGLPAHTHCNNCCDCPMCSICGKPDQLCPVTNTAQKKHCIRCCKCAYYMPIHTRDVEGEWQIQPFVPSPKQLTKNKLARLLAAELEIGGIPVTMTHDKFNRVCKTKWKARVMGDGSLPRFGFEMPTQPAGGDLWVDMITEICELLAEGKAWCNQQAGTHLHVDTRDLDGPQLYRVLELYSVVEDAMYKLVHPSRRANHYSTPCGGDLLAKFGKLEKMEFTMQDMELLWFDNVVQTRTTKDGKLEVNDGVSWKLAPSKTQRELLDRAKQQKSGGPNRYRGLNLQSHFMRGSIEFRMHHGTVNPDTIINWGIVCGSVIEWAKEHSLVGMRKMFMDTNKDPMATLTRVVVDVTGKNEMLDWITARAAKLKAHSKEIAWLGDR